MIKPTFLALSLAFFFVSNSNAQDRNTSRDTSTTVIIFNGGSSSSSSIKKRDDLNVIKISPLAFLSGKLPLNYERSITDLLSVQLGVGLTSKNYVGTAWLSALETSEASSGSNESVKVTHSPLPPGAIDESEALYGFETRIAKPGYLFTVQPRLYFDQEGVEGSFIGVAYEYYRYNYQVPTFTMGDDSYSAQGSLIDEFEKISDLMVYFGWQNVYDRLTFEYSAGVGKRSAKGSKYEAGYQDENFYSGMNRYTRSVLNFQLSLKVGFHF